MSENLNEQDIEEARLLSLTLSIRENLLSKLLKDNKIPEDKADKSLTVSLLDGIDRTILSRKRLKAETAQANIQGQAANIIAAILLRSEQLIQPPSSKLGTIPMLGDVGAEFDFHDGEKEVGTQHDSIESFNKRMGLDET